MTPDERFLQTIIENPDDDAPRLVYADYLEEHGQPERAEFIRVQCELARLPEASRRKPLEAREEKLLRGHGEKWTSPLRELCEKWRFQRGMVEAIEVRAALLLSHAEELFRLAPVRHVRLTGVESHLTDLVRSPFLERLRGLDLTQNQLGDEGAKLLAECAGLRSLRTLRLAGCGLRQEGVEAIVASPNLEGLDRVDLGGNYLGEADTQVMLHDWALTQLTDLSFQGTFIDIEELVRLPLLATLRVLDLGENDLRFSDEDAAALARCEYLAGLTALHLRHCGIGDEGAKALASSPNFGRLVQLNLLNNDIESAGVEAVLASPSLASLTRLDLGMNPTGDAGAALVAASPRFGKLLELGLSYNGISDEGARALAGSPHPFDGRKLELFGNNISTEVKQALQSRFGSCIHF